MVAPLLAVGQYAGAAALLHTRGTASGPFLPRHGTSFWNGIFGASLEPERIFGMSGNFGTQRFIQADQGSDVAGQDVCSTVQIAQIEQRDLAFVSGQYRRHIFRIEEDASHPEKM